ncbi:8714_t:CDS:2, partial [Cetraspora pellucida]
TVKSEHPDALVEDGNKFVKALIKHLQGIRFFTLIGPFLRHYIPIIRDVANSYLKNRDYIFDKLDLIIKKRREEIEEIPVGTEMRSDMLTSLIIANTKKDTAKIKTVGGETFEPMTDQDIRSNLVDAFIAGTDSLKYCEAIIKEANRMIPVVNFVTRYMTEECEVAGYKWAAGTTFHINITGVHGHREVWPNPEVFDPGRFYDVDQDNETLENKYSLIIFGGGPRICPGRKLAMNELLLSMVTIYRYYNVELVNMDEPLKIVTAGANNVQELK